MNITEQQLAIFEPKTKGDIELRYELQKAYNIVNGWIVETKSNKGAMVSKEFKDVPVKPFRFKNKDIVAESPCGFYWISKNNNWLKKEKK